MSTCFPKKIDDKEDACHLWHSAFLLNIFRNRTCQSGEFLVCPGKLSTVLSDFNSVSFFSGIRLQIPRLPSPKGFQKDLLLREKATGWGGLGYWASADGKAALAEIEQMLAANPHCIIETNDAGGNQLTADYAAARGIDLDGLRVGISGSVGQMFGALFGSEHLGTLLLTGGDTLLQCMNSVGARELEPVCELESGIVLARFTYQGRTRYVITKSGGFGQEDLLVELADRIAKH